MTDRPPPPPVPGSGPPPPPPASTGRHADVRFGEVVDLRSPRAADAFRVPFSVGDAFVALLVYFVAQLMVGLFAGVTMTVLTGDFTVDDTSLLVMTVVSQVIALVASVGYLGLRGRLSWRILGPVRPGLVTVLLGFAVGVLGTIVAYTINAGLTLVFDPQTPVEQQLLDDVLTGGVTTVVVVLAAVVMAPIAEELLFRGLLFQALRRRLGLWFAAFVSAGLFCVVHVEIVVSQPLALVGLFVLGVVLAWGFHRTGSIVVPILAHATFNAISLGLAVFAQNAPLADLTTGFGLLAVR